ncbi:NAD(P)H-dependent flavin oxidoreductase [Lysinibacillus sp. LZ02]|uniref:NAD(P)H-dependent flavin oxidoreductase n=1 Tax=Lysinibacillus sp. LZ02 TaxID=3420668 RepID=UPI003D35C166
MLNKLRYPIIQAPMAGGISPVSLAKAISSSGGLGFLAAGYKTVEALEHEILEMQQGNDLFGVNLFVPQTDAVNEKELHAFMTVLQQDVGRELGKPMYSDDEWEGKLALVKKYKVPVASFTFGCPDKVLIEQLQVIGTYVIVTVTTVQEAKLAVSQGANAICLQGYEAGGHQASFENIDIENPLPLVALLRKVKEVVHIPIIVAGGIMNGEQIKQLLAEGADAVQLGTAFICCDESGANEVYRQALQSGEFASTKLTRAFTGRLARGLENAFVKNYSPVAPKAYPALHYVTQPIRKKAIAEKNAQVMSLWAGIGYQQIRPLPAKELFQLLVEEAGLE